jgi:hypothetical protein
MKMDNMGTDIRRRRCEDKIGQHRLRKKSENKNFLNQ